MSEILNSQHIPLILNTSILPDSRYGGTNSFGTRNISGSICTWSNIDLRALLGFNYDKYKKYNLYLKEVVCLNNYITGIASTSDIITPSAYKYTYFSISGLNWISNYNISLKSYFNETVLYSLNFQNFNQTTLGMNLFDDSVVQTFTIAGTPMKTDININLRSIFTGDVLTAIGTQRYSDFVFIFDIVPII